MASGEVDMVGKLSQDRIKQLMNSDPKFISRLIGDLDKQMHKMIKQKAEKQAQIDADKKEVAKLDDLVATNIKPKMDKLEDSICSKTQMRDDLKRQLSTQTEGLKQMQQEAAVLMQSTRMLSKKLMGKTATQRLEEARGFSSTMPTTTLLKGTKKQDTNKGGTT